MILEHSIATTQRTLWKVKAMPYFRETSISFVRVCGYNKLNEFNEGNVVFADVTTDQIGVLLAFCTADVSSCGRSYPCTA